MTDRRAEVSMLVAQAMQETLGGKEEELLKVSYANQALVEIVGNRDVTSSLRSIHPSAGSISLFESSDRKWELRMELASGDEDKVLLVDRNQSSEQDFEFRATPVNQISELGNQEVRKQKLNKLGEGDNIESPIVFAPLDLVGGAVNIEKGQLGLTLEEIILRTPTLLNELTPEVLVVGMRSAFK